MTGPSDDRSRTASSESHIFSPIDIGKSRQQHRQLPGHDAPLQFESSARRAASMTISWCSKSRTPSVWQHPCTTPDLHVARAAHDWISPIGQCSPVCPVPAPCSPSTRPPAAARGESLRREAARSLSPPLIQLCSSSALFRILSTAMQTQLLPRSCNHSMGHVVNGVC
ncbi:uncharacterized protein BDZ99DRAFT_288317 [Mytilinidion resinicola]|uniref:Uncharacterized protein n=1 Tax=Mytilinidion resinicola TaxID=574789 RepID=A0A6A6YQE0_9PEZI|nr:uncharacterized protein BDZ99DRAFT_288317 [Mytilinidion resinicola]KAF2810748.1 hypothetical protein BDZ99DRAFT_288317 [Mytilinidion resinicola]